MSITANATRLREQAAEELRALLARRRMSVSELARRLGVAQSYMARRVDGRVAMDLDDLERIADVLDVDVFDLVPSRTRNVGQPTDRTRGTFAEIHHPQPTEPARPVTTRQSPPDNRPSGRAAKSAPAARTRRPRRLPRPHSA